MDPFVTEGSSFLGVFLLKKTKHLFVFKFTASFVPAPCLCQYWSSDMWSDACLTPEKLSCIHSPISNDGLPGQLLIPGLLESQELQDWICRVNVFPCKSHIHLIHGMPKSRDSALFCKRQKIWGVGGPNYSLTWGCDVWWWGGGLEHGRRISGKKETFSGGDKVCWSPCRRASIFWDEMRRKCESGKEMTSSLRLSMVCTGHGSW